MADAIVVPSTTPEPIEDTFYGKSELAASTPAKDPKDISSAASVKTGTAGTEAAPEPAEHETEPIVDASSKSPRLSWRELRTKKDQAEAQVELLKQQLAERNKAVPQTVAPAAAVPAVDPTKPKSEDFPTYDDYLDAREKWNRAGWERQNTEKTQQAEREKTVAEAQVENAKRLQGWTAQEKVVMAKQPDYTAQFAVFLKVAEQTPALAVAVYKSDIGPDLAQHLGANPDELARIAKLPAEGIWKAIGVLEDKLTAPEGSVTPTITKAPPPLKSVPGNARGVQKELSIEETFYGKD